VYFLSEYRDFLEEKLARKIEHPAHGKQTPEFCGY
jgi:hypothetical protein